MISIGKGIIMIRGLYISSTGMITQTKKMDTVTNNLANVETKGYKSDKLLSRSFNDMLIERINDPAVVNVTQAIGPLNSGIHIDEVYTSFEQGPIENTGNQTDLAILGDGFFVVDTPNGIRYTRAGNFIVDAEGYLSTNEGNRVLSQNGPIYIGSGKFTVTENGIVQTENNNYRLRIAAFANNGTLRKEGSNLYYNYEGQPELQSNAKISQGALEGSNVDIASSVIEMINISRNFESNQSIIKMLDSSLNKAVNEIGKV